MKRWQLLCAAAVTGCGLINSNTLSTDYAFDAQQYRADLGQNGEAKVPVVPCDPDAQPDPCGQLHFGERTGGACERDRRQCVAVADVSLAYTVDYRTAQTQLPAPVVQYTIDRVRIKKVAYWITRGGLNVAVPPIDLYVAPSAAVDELDPKAEKIGSIAGLPAGAMSCLDNVDKAGDPAAGITSAVCDVPLTDSGERALAEYVKAYKTTPFKLIAHTRIVAHGDDPVPSGMLEFVVRPTVTFSLLSN
jgi:hypothetical protein